MPLAHTCASCGLDLSRIAAPLDAVYGLPIVVCPECRTAVVRRSDGHRLLSRSAVRTSVALKQLLGVPLAWGLMFGVVIVPALLNAELLRHSRLDVWSAAAQLVHLQERDARFESWNDDLGGVVLVSLALAGAAAGAFVTQALPHLRRRVVIPLFAVMLLGALYLPGSIEWIVQWADAGMSGRSVRSVERQYREEIAATRALSLAAASAPFGIPVGRRVRRMFDRIGRRRWRKLRRRMRKRRQGL